jgi:hypothetical protein
MAAITDLSDLVNRLTGGNSGTPEIHFFYKDDRIDAAAVTTASVGRWTSLWRFEGIPCGADAWTNAAVAVSNTHGGAASGIEGGPMLITNPGGVRQKWLVGMSAMASQAGTLMLYDRQIQYGLATSTGAQNLTGMTVVGGRYGTSYAGNQIWLEVGVTLLAAQTDTVSATYTNQAGTGSRQTPAVAIGQTGSREAARIIMLPLAAGDTGVQSIQSITITGTTMATGVLAATIVRPLLALHIPGAGAAVSRDLISGFPQVMEIKSGAGLSLAWYNTTTTTAGVMGNIVMVEA